LEIDVANLTEAIAAADRFRATLQAGEEIDEESGFTAEHLSLLIDGHRLVGMPSYRRTDAQLLHHSEYSDRGHDLFPRNLNSSDEVVPS
jgi:hypothetical protein